MRKVPDTFKKKLVSSSLGSKVMARVFLIAGQDKELSRQADKSIVKFSRLIQEKGLDQKNMKYHMLADSLRYGVSMDEYFLFRFYEIPEQNKSQFLGAFGGIKVWKACADQYENNPNSIFRNKYLCAQKFADFFKRGIFNVTADTSVAELQEFLEQHPHAILKPLDESEGRGIEKIEYTTATPEELVQMILQKQPCVLEEFIEQGDVLAQLHPGSVNTVRYVTISNAGKVHSIYAILRIGCGDSHIDNLAAGGICTAINMKTGELMTDGFREDCTRFEQHPDSHLTIRGLQLPQWQECRKMIRTAALRVPKQHLVGWDLAYSVRYGWMIVEANHRPSFTGFQFCTGIGTCECVEKAMQD